tara:strand:+ start:664 stop:870 length:207 start_codon:yes stop_codon:yes gene_type:complete
MLMHIMFPQIIFIHIKFQNCNNLLLRIDRAYFFILVNYSPKLMGINKKGAILALAIIAFIICIGAGSG